MDNYSYYVLQFKGYSEHGGELLYCTVQRIHNSNNLLNCFIDKIEIPDPHSFAPGKTAKLKLFFANAISTKKEAERIAAATNKMFKARGQQ